MSGLYLPGAVWRPVSYRAASGTFPSGKPYGYIPHVQEGNGSLFNMFNGLHSPYRKFSTAWIRKDGYSEQYCELNRIPWSQGDGNPLYHAFECEGKTGEGYTQAQINTLANWHNFLGTPDVILTSPTGRGISAHRLGGAAWGGHTCPGDLRYGQRDLIIARAKELRGRGSVPSRGDTRTPLVITKASYVAHDVNNLQAAVGVPVDGHWGADTDINAVQLRNAMKGVAFDVRLVQRILKVTADGAFGPVSRAALAAKKRQMQIVLKVTSDGVWGTQSESGFWVLRAKFHNKF